MADRRFVALALAGSLLLAACSSSTSQGAFPAGSFALIANRDIGPGRSRVLVAISEADGTRLGSPDYPLRFTASPADDPASAQTQPGVFTWIIEDVIGLYRVQFDFDRPGAWQITVEPESGPAPEPATVIVYEETFTPSIGEPAVAAPTPTLAEHPLEELTTDPDPDVRFYEMSLEEALASGRRTVLVFSTPAYCQTATCGPLLDTVKGIAPDFADVNFIHVEVYTGLTDPDFAPDAAHLAPSAGADYWNLPTEPWVFVIDEAGIVTARFEGVMGGDELQAALSPS
jgi:hypothetical protein